MAMQIDCYLSFEGNCEDALNFYAQCLGGKVSAVMRYDSMPKDSGFEVPPDFRNKVMHASVEAEGAQIMGSDMPPGTPDRGQFKGFSVSVWVKDGVDRARQIFDALGAGGQVTMPFAPPFWGGHFGMVVDKFGVSWMVSCE